MEPEESKLLDHIAMARLILVMSYDFLLCWCSCLSTVVRYALHNMKHWNTLGEGAGCFTFFNPAAMLLAGQRHTHFLRSGHLPFILLLTPRGCAQRHSHSLHSTWYAESARNIRRYFGSRGTHTLCTTVHAVGCICIYRNSGKFWSGLIFVQPEMCEI